MNRILTKSLHILMAHRTVLGGGHNLSSELWVALLCVLFRSPIQTLKQNPDGKQSVSRVVVVVMDQEGLDQWQGALNLPQRVLFSL